MLTTKQTTRDVHISRAGPLRKEEPNDDSGAALEIPEEIARPRSALHSGDFREGITPLPTQAGQPDDFYFENLSSSPTTPWFTAPFHSPRRSQRLPSFGYDQNTSPGSRSRAPSIGSYSSSYVLKAPTSPLVHQANNTDLDFSPKTDLNYLDKVNRRRTLPPESFRGLDSSLPDSSSTANFGTPPRSSSSLYTLQLASSMYTSPLRARRLSLASDGSAKPNARMVGSYEESILRGRMSMSPSKPLDFTAEIGVLGKGNCKANLKCPPHVTVPFPAVFYSYPTSGYGRSIADDSPSPYVGLIDLENSLAKDETSKKNHLHRRHRSSTDDASGDPFTDAYGSKAIVGSSRDARLLRREKGSRRSNSPKRPAGGSYRIPQEGQLQIVIKNPNKTAVKLFLVPYDLSDMQPGTKTFIRQRSYTAGPTVDMPLSVRNNLDTDHPEASLNATDEPKGKPVLRYLIHLNICCPSRGRFFLHSGIRVVFANRVPDGKEKLRYETQYPEPRYSPYKYSPELGLTRRGDRSYRRPSEGFGGMSGGDDIQRRIHPSGFLTGISAISPLQLPPVMSPSTTMNERLFSTELGISRSRRDSLESDLLGSPHTGMYNKLSKGDARYGGQHSFSSLSNGTEAGESLLAQRLKGLDVEKRHSHSDRVNGD